MHINQLQKNRTNFQGVMALNEFGIGFIAEREDIILVICNLFYLN